MTDSIRASFWALLVVCAVVVGCRGQASPGANHRIVSIAPSTTEAVFALGAGAELVGRSRQCDFPPEAARLPAVGGYADPSVEAIVALAPTLVVGARGPAGPALEQALEARGIATFFPETESLGQIDAMLSELGRRLGRETAAAQLVGSMHSRCRAVEQAVHEQAPVRAVMLFDVAPIVVAGPGGFPDELMRRAGADNLIRAGGAYPTLGIERLIALDPDVVLDGASNAEDGPGEKRVESLRDAPGWRELRAVREGRVRLVNAAVVLRPGPRICDGLATLASAVHGGQPLP